MVFTKQELAISLFEIQEKYTSATLGVFTNETLNKPPVAGFRTVTQLAIHCSIVRASVLADILADDSIRKDVKASFPNGEQAPAITLKALLEMRLADFEIFRARFGRIDWDSLDSPFKTHFGNYSTPRNYLSLILQEEIHHRGQMILIARLFGLTPPEAPYSALAELGVQH